MPDWAELMTVSRKMNNRYLTFLLLLVMTAYACSIRAQEDASWHSLSGEQQQVLQGLEHRWEELSPGQRQNLIRGAERWLKMSPREKRQMQRRFREWRQKSPEQRRNIRQRFERFNSLPPRQQQRLRERQRWFNNLPLEQRRQLRDTFQNRFPAERRGNRGQNGADRPASPAPGRMPRGR